ncbi:von Willebrand factor type A domain protein [Planctomycetes bacterium CA13]|uniref:von Willebrand factor type A domain protein n=2 Tax=Novipirellula herctigrandis TaxID=2527986 RepID=A0A5C5Z0R2_9BACT|nr:von Willebrand factor type A domain protein [Planctomycetes bacterium CA13]
MCAEFVGSMDTCRQLIESPRPASRRNGTVMALMAFLLPVLALLAAFCINAAQMQLTQTELMVATDAAARAGGRAFSEQQTIEAATVAAIATAALNDVNGEPLQIRAGESAAEIEFGITTQPSGLTGRYEFNKMPMALVESGEMIASAIRVNGNRDNTSVSGRVPFIIPGILDSHDFASHQQSVAMQVDRDITLVLDRSGSMFPDPRYHWPYHKGPNYMTAAEQEAAVAADIMTAEPEMRWVRVSGRWERQPTGNTVYQRASGVSRLRFEQWLWGEQNCPTQPWQDLVLAVDAFLSVLDATVQEEQVSFASYSSNASLDIGLTKDFSSVRSGIYEIAPSGGTAIGLGMRTGMPALTSAAARPYAAKTMVVMTDGNENSGSMYALPSVQQLVAQCPLTIHTVTFGSGADKDAMRAVALAGGGKHYHADTGAELISTFQEIANNLPSIITQ